MNIAIVSTNRNKYSETFIHNHVKLIPGNIHFLFDGYLPKQYSTDKGITSHLFRDHESKWFRFLKKKVTEKNTNLESAIGKYLKKNEIDLIFAEYGPSGVEMMEISKKTQIPLLVHFHGYDAYRDDILASYGKKYTELFGIAKVIVVVSAHMRSHLIGLGCEPSKLHVMPCGIDTKIFQISNSAPRELVFVSCSRFVEKKAPDITIKAFAKILAKIPSAKLTMIGEGELHEESKGLAEKLGVKHAIQFTGKLKQDKIASIYNQAFAFIQPSLTTAQNDAEGSPLTILEAGACGLPVISTKHGGISDVIIDGETGFLVNENDIDALAQKMLLLAGNPALAFSMGKKACARVGENYSLESYTQKLVTLIHACT
jgi:colanic acid/amylovoran biosynthesis glycosyltransferase